VFICEKNLRVSVENLNKEQEITGEKGKGGKGERETEERGKVGNGEFVSQHNKHHYKL
jgi:hypothetical protein